MTQQQTDSDALREQVRARYAASGDQAHQRRLWLWAAGRLWLWRRLRRRRRDR